MSHRLFVALRPPEPVRAALLAVMAGVREARWQTDNQLHLTLAFIGEVDRHALATATDALATIQRPAMPLVLDGIGSFATAPRGRISGLWAGVRGPSAPAPASRQQDPLPALAATVRQTLVRHGLPVDGRRFLPHLTLARFGRAGASADSLRRWLATTRLPPLRWQADSFHLVESFPGAGGSHYEIVASFRLAD